MRLVVEKKVPRGMGDDKHQTRQYMRKNEAQEGSAIDPRGASNSRRHKWDNTTHPVPERRAAGPWATLPAALCIAGHMEQNLINAYKILFQIGGGSILENKTLRIQKKLIMTILTPRHDKQTKAQKSL